MVSVGVRDNDIGANERISIRIAKQRTKYNRSCVNTHKSYVRTRSQHPSHRQTKQQAYLQASCTHSLTRSLTHLPTRAATNGCSSRSTVPFNSSGSTATVCRSCQPQHPECEEKMPSHRPATPTTQRKPTVLPVITTTTTNDDDNENEMSPELSHEPAATSPACLRHTTARCRPAR